MAAGPDAGALKSRSVANKLILPVEDIAQSRETYSCNGGYESQATGRNDSSELHFEFLLGLKNHDGNNISRN